MATTPRELSPADFDEVMAFCESALTMAVRFRLSAGGVSEPAADAKPNDGQAGPDAGRKH